MSTATFAAARLMVKSFHQPCYGQLSNSMQNSKREKDCRNFNNKSLLSEKMISFFKNNDENTTCMCDLYLCHLSVCCNYMNMEGSMEKYTRLKTQATGGEGLGRREVGWWEVKNK